VQSQSYHNLAYLVILSLSCWLHPCSYVSALVGKPPQLVPRCNDLHIPSVAVCASMLGFVLIAI
jgi:hypothetical protein